MDKRTDNISAKNVMSPFDVEALKKCLEENKGDYLKCQSQVEAFRSLCSLKNPGMNCRGPSLLLIPLPHKAETKVEICGFTVPKDAQVLVNTWATVRDLSISFGTILSLGIFHRSLGQMQSYRSNTLPAAPLIKPFFLPLQHLHHTEGHDSAMEACGVT
ncbi:hypothetical protein NE237_032414 [Protea cynaroides]|uniref:Uncharacterized protein n=1 Tax=Protea cynaroides TaxID=273540 RepID=A0A9Q0L325_9MAGN|nr:hypothetical protein NE237_032414 [Protea cynaroides]